MKVTFSNNTSEKIKMNKSLSNKKTYDCFLKEDCSITKPILIIESELPILYNYCEIADFKRMYFVTDVISIGRNIWQVSLQCDVLSSFKNEIKECSCVMDRQEFNYNLNIPDGNFKVTKNNFTCTYKIGSGDFSNSKLCIMLLSNSKNVV